MAEIRLGRRAFLVSTAVVAGGLSLWLLPAHLRKAAGVLGAKSDSAAAPGSELSSWIEIAADDVVTVRSPTPEIGNGSMTQIAMNIAEELGCDWSKVRVVSASARRDYLEKGSYSIGRSPFFSGHSTDHERMPYTMQLGASARERLKTAAASRWGVPVSEIEARNSVLTHKPSSRTLRYGEVAADAATVKLAAEPALKPQSEWTLLGKATLTKLSAPQIANGTAIFGIDVQIPGMVYAALLQSPVQRGKLKHHDPSAVLKMPGVRAVVVLDPSKTKGSPLKSAAPFTLATTETQSAVAVIADHYWQARKALEALPVEWDNGAGETWKTSNQVYAAARAVAAKPPEKILKQTGNINAAPRPKKTVEATYLTPFCENAAMEPLNGTALVTADKVEVWHPCQDSQQALWVAVDETGMAPENVEVHQTLVGGGFGRRSLADDVRMVVAVAREYPGVPVKVIWSREETMRQGRYRTLIAAHFSAGLDEHGAIQTLRSNSCFSGMALPLGLSDMPYVASGAIPNASIGSSALPMHILTGAYRGPCYNTHAFMVDTFIDECAIAAKVDPLEYRLRLLANWDPAWSQCLNIAAQKSGWGEKLPKGQGRGIAISNWPMSGLRQAGSTVCAAARVEVSREGALTVKQIDFTFDCGRVVNRDAVAAQLEGGVIFGLNMTLNEEITLQDGVVVESNFHNYPMLRIGDMPQINIHFDALSGHDRFAMIGEAPVGPIGAAVGNAIFQATGKRIRTTPFRKQDLSWT